MCRRLPVSWSGSPGTVVESATGRAGPVRHRRTPRAQDGLRCRRPETTRPQQSSSEVSPELQTAPRSRPRRTSLRVHNRVRKPERDAARTLKLGQPNSRTIRSGCRKTGSTPNASFPKKRTPTSRIPHSYALPIEATGSMREVGLMERRRNRSDHGAVLRPGVSSHLFSSAGNWLLLRASPVPAEPTAPEGRRPRPRSTAVCPVRFRGWDRPTPAGSCPIPWGRGRWARHRYGQRFLMEAAGATHSIFRCLDLQVSGRYSRGCVVVR